MGLAASNCRLLALTQRKADCQYGISINSMQKMALSREMSNLSQEYYSRLQSKQISFYNNGKYNKINYGYLMGHGSNYTAIWNNDKYALKSENSMILSDFNGRVVLSSDYANAITCVLGSSAMDVNGRGGTFSTDKIPEMLAALCPGRTVDEFRTIINGDSVSSNYDATGVNTLTGEENGNDINIDNSSTVTEKLQAVVDFYLPIFTAAAANGWTTEYNQDMALNEDYLSDALVTGTFQLASVDETGQYDEGTSLTYFVTAGLIDSRSDSEVREEITAWFNLQKEDINAKETLLDLNIENLSTELESINTEIQSIQTFIDDAISSVFDWGKG